MVKVWKLVGKSKDYVKENAPSVLEMVADAEKAMELDPSGKNLKKTKEMLIRELKNDLEEPWCCIDSLAPIKSVGLAVLIFTLKCPIICNLSVCLSLSF